MHDKLSSYSTYLINRNLIIGPELTHGDLDILKQAGVTRIEKINLPTDLPPAKIAEKLLSYLDGKKGIFYYYGFNQWDMDKVAETLNGRQYGININTFPKKFDNEPIRIINGRLVVGPSIRSEEIKDISLEGISTIVYLNDKDEENTNEFKLLKKGASATGLTLIELETKGDYLKLIADLSMKNNNPVYVIINKRSRDQLVKKLIQGKLF